jgi:hypothetical protein
MINITGFSSYILEHFKNLKQPNRCEAISGLIIGQNEVTRWFFPLVLVLGLGFECESIRFRPIEPLPPEPARNRIMRAHMITELQQKKEETLTTRSAIGRRPKLHATSKACPFLGAPRCEPPRRTLRL